MGAASTRRGDGAIRRHSDQGIARAVARMPQPQRSAARTPVAPAAPAPTRTSIAAWMRAHAEEYRDRRTGEINTTALVEGWDRACADGGATLDSDHIAWDLACAFE